MELNSDEVLAAQDLAVHIPVRRPLTDVVMRRPQQMVRAVDGVSLEVRPGELVALVGESGSGKTTTARALLGMQSPTAGTITLGGSDVNAMPRAELRRFRRRVQMVYQDPYESLSPRQRVSELLTEGLVIHKLGDRENRIAQALRDVGLTPAERYLDRYPHELSGGQRQRVAIACALVLKPRFLLADEPVSMLDVSVRTGVLNVFHDLRREHGLGILMITHDLVTAVAVADRVVVMRTGRIVEEGQVRNVLTAPQHPYTRELLDAVAGPAMED